jgi:hypothetical protein
MTCSECQAQIFEQELDRDALVHLAACEECGALDREVRLNAEALTSMRDDVLPVRPGRTSRPWQWGVAVAAAAIAAFLLSYRAAEEFAGPLGETIVAKLPEPEIPVPVIVGVPGMLLPAAPAVGTLLPPPPVEEKAPKQDMLVQMITDDPDVVIYWLVGQIEGEGI